MQVWYRGKLQGRMRGHVQTENGKALFFKADPDSDLVSVEFAISLNTRNHEIPKFDVTISNVDVPAFVANELMLEEGEYQQAVDFYRDAIRIRWQVIAPKTNEEYEFLFDQPAFEAL